ncbi:hypothetical protein HanIR_Chr03g0115441 [Helianthus annuus]|nr:hypothetical protein HanIR_Chr03g0115441 [Helianthus annuus]
MGVALSTFHTLFLKIIILKHFKFYPSKSSFLTLFTLRIHNQVHLTTTNHIHTQILRFRILNSTYTIYILQTKLT